MAKQVIEWNWEEAFNKFGFGDGDDWNGTHIIFDFMEGLGFKNIEPDTWGMHNYMIFSMKDKKGKKYEFDGYEDPRKILPRSVVKKLDKKYA